MTTDYARYIAGLPKILAGASMLCRSADGRILIVEPNYRDDGTWTLPGGTIESDRDETPREGARRETAEEIGLDLVPGALLMIDWSSGPERPPSVSYLYDGGVLSDRQLAAVRLQEEELDSWRLIEPAETDRYFSPGQAGRIRAALAALTGGTGPAELVNGRPAAEV
ncbi:NUDIX hydrolase [Streptomyces cocklensis]|jgi:ADP-ribose pyrophosphatase YjhB (NUDIX family)|uniref:ADP-ribose pyrophosphatase YjhB, NUDIX family n=1 Tax=Actinacidiphila cocklensis TaxID=887465 RepID=A0A9W4GUZ1_9ACTN|nr:NUDIX hydrolase [Actinacidiphila cocklensis]MDD1061844.1 NUDIX hydrolase [Actinacidiphila cocklensis]WSX76085.1 NUDIX hydrolase [Streptomyces sp. NBC_00899]CAG6396187.1 ADP-ribose pyrophosphatase YjhB, NUDIX family [Actinacidiphila cocklensis]